MRAPQPYVRAHAPSSGTLGKMQGLAASGTSARQGVRWPRMRMRTRRPSSPALRLQSCAQDVREKRSFFNSFYAAINLGSLLACTVVVYVQEYYSWAVGFAIPAVAMALAIAVFVSGNSRYKHIKPSERWVPDLQAHESCHGASSHPKGLEPCRLARLTERVLGAVLCCQGCSCCGPAWLAASQVMRGAQCRSSAERQVSAVWRMLQAWCCGAAMACQASAHTVPVRVQPAVPLRQGPLGGLQTQAQGPCSQRGGCAGPGLGRRSGRTRRWASPPACTLAGRQRVLTGQTEVGMLPGRQSCQRQAWCSQGAGVVCDPAASSSAACVGSCMLAQPA